MSDVSIDVEAPDSDVGLRTLELYYAELATRFPGGFDSAGAFSTPAAELQPPHGVLLVLRVDGEPVGCGGVRQLSDEVAEIKRMWIGPRARGRGLGRRLLSALEDAAAGLGCRIVRLDTNDHLPEALQLYRSAGYSEIAAYNDNPYAAHWFEKSLRANSMSLSGRLPPD